MKVGRRTYGGCCNAPWRYLWSIRIRSVPEPPRSSYVRTLRCLSTCPPWSCTLYSICHSWWKSQSFQSKSLLVSLFVLSVLLFWSILWIWFIFYRVFKKIVFVMCWFVKCVFYYTVVVYSFYFIFIFWEAVVFFCGGGGVVFVFDHSAPLTFAG